MNKDDETILETMREAMEEIQLAALAELMAEKEVHEGGMLAANELNHPSCDDWMRLYNKLAAARDLLKGRSA